MDTPTQGTQSQYEGVSNPPNGGQVTDIANPESNDATTVPQTSAPSTPPPTPTPQSAPVSAPQTPGQQSQNGPQNNPQNKTDLSKGPKQPTAPTAPVNSPETSPAVKKAGLFHDIAQTLAGGPRYSYSIDAMGNMQKKEVPVSGKHLALALAMEALTGAAAGFGVKNGPGNEGRAAAAGFEASMAQQKQITQQQKDEATQDYARRAQTTEMNMRMYTNARTLGKMDAEDIDAYLGQYKDLADKLQTEFPGYIKGVASYKDLSKYNVTADTAIPYKRVPRLGNDGKQVEINGRPQWDMDYLIIDPSFKSTGLLSPDDTKTLSAWGQTGMDNPNISDAPLNARLAMNKKSMATQLGLAEKMFSGFFDTVNQANGSGATVPTDLKSGRLTAPTLNPKIQGMVDNAAAKYAPSVNSLTTPDNFQALLRSLVSQESSGNPNAKSSTGATGLGQFTTTTAKKYGLIDAQGNDFRTDPVKNADATAHYFSDLLKQYQGDPKKALAAYYSGPGAIGVNGQIQNTQAHSAADTQKYIDTVGGRINLMQPSNIESAKTAPSPTDFAKTHATFASDVEKFMGAYNALPPGSEGQVGTALAHLRQTGQGDAANNIAAYLTQNGTDAIKLHDDYNTTQAEIRKADIQRQEAELKAHNKEEADAAVQQKKEDSINTLLTAKIPDNFLKMDDRDAVNALHNTGVTLPTDAIIDAKLIANYGAPATLASNKRWFKDGKYDQGELTSIVRMFNPAYDEKNYAALRSEKMPNSPQRKTIDSAAQLANHLDQMHSIINGPEASQTPYPFMNKLLQQVGYQTGGTQLTDVRAMANIVTSELGKTLAGGFAPDKTEIDNIIKTMTPENAQGQMNKILDKYMDAMLGKVKPLDEEYNSISGASDQHLPMPKSLTTVLQKYGKETPWEKNTFAQPQQKPAFTPGDNSQFAKISKDGKIGLTASGQKVDIATGQLIQ